MHDHRKLGRELGLFGTDPLFGAGLPYWLPAGAAVRHALEEYLRELERRAGYQHVYSPVLGKRELYEMSGHWSHYRDGRRIRSSRLVPYQAVIGGREATAGQVAVRLRDGRRLPPLPADAALAGIAAHVAAHRTDLWDAAAPLTAGGCAGTGGPGAG